MSIHVNISTYQQPSESSAPQVIKRGKHPRDQRSSDPHSSDPRYTDPHYNDPHYKDPLSDSHRDTSPSSRHPDSKPGMFRNLNARRIVSSGPARRTR